MDRCHREMGLDRAACLTVTPGSVAQFSGGKRTGIPQQTSLGASGGELALTPAPLCGRAVSLGCMKGESKSLSKIEYSQDKPRPASLGMTPKAQRQVAGAKGCRQPKKVESWSFWVGSGACMQVLDSEVLREGHV